MAGGANFNDAVEPQTGSNYITNTTFSLKLCWPAATERAAARFNDQSGKASATFQPAFVLNAALRSRPSRATFRHEDHSAVSNCKWYKS